jgi:hypothetical protein
LESGGSQFRRKVNASRGEANVPEFTSTDIIMLSALM